MASVFRVIIGLSPRSEQTDRWFGSRISHRDSIAIPYIAKGSEHVRGGHVFSPNLVILFYHWLDSGKVVLEPGSVGELGNPGAGSKVVQLE